MPDPLVVVTRSAEATRRLGAALGSALEPVPRAGITVALFGDLGAGKTVFVSGIARGLGVPDATPVVSPTFTVARAYRGRAPLHHLDAYHVRSLAELEAAGYEDMGGSGRVTVVEWGDRVEDALPADRLEVTLIPAPDAVPAGAPIPDEPPRRVTIAAHGPQSERVLARLRASADAVLAS